MPNSGNDSSNPDTSHNTGTAGKGSDGSPQHIRNLAMPFTKGQMITEADGSLLIKDVPMLAEGVWTDSAVGTPLNYIPKTLEEYAGNWLDNSGWNRHTGGQPRPSTDKVGEAVNPHFGQFIGKDGQPHQGILSDVRIWPWTQNQRDMQEMVRHGLINYVSVEHGGDERYNATTRQMEASTLAFTGFAFVNKGACKLCRLNEQAAPDEKITPPPKEQDTMDTKELEDKITSLSKELEAIKAQKPAEIKADIPKELAELPALIKELSAKNIALEAQVKELASRPDRKTGNDNRELDAGKVETSVVFDKNSRVIRGA